MKSFTIHAVDDPLAKLIKSKAKSEGLSINQTIKIILESSLGAKPRKESSQRDDFEEFCSSWTEADLAVFKENTKALRKVEPGDWR